MASTSDRLVKSQPEILFLSFFILMITPAFYLKQEFYFIEGNEYTFLFRINACGLTFEYAA